MINNIPVAITANETTSSAVTSGGNVYQTGLIGGKIHYSFNEIITNENIVGRVIDAKATDDRLYLLNSGGSVFEYAYNSGTCVPLVREVYSPAACGGDKAIKIEAGRAHILILTEANKIWGAGNNEQYQLVPQGQCRYDTAVEIIVTDTNVHDNECPDTFSGIYNELECPVIPVCEKDNHNISCVKKNLCDVLLGYINVSHVVIEPTCQSGTLSIPVYGDINYVGFLCVDKTGCATGSVTYTINRVYIKCGCFVGKFTHKDSCGCHVRELNISSTCQVLIFQSNPCPSANTDLCAQGGSPPITGTTQITGKCGSCVIANVDVPCDLALPSVAFEAACKTIVLCLNDCKTSLAVLCDGALNDYCVGSTTLDLDFDVPLDCEAPKIVRPEIELPQPCWAGIYAGFDISVLVDNCNRIYVFGSLHNIRSNKDLLRGSCLEELLNKTNASISFPADQLNCGGNRSVRNDNCPCPKCKDKEFKTDLNKFGIHLSFPSGEDECSKNMNVCDFLQSLKTCNESQSCDNTCEPCDGYIYLNVSGNCGCPCGAPASSPIGSVTLFNKKSICKLASQNCPDIAKISVDVNTIVEFDLNKYCIDSTDVALDKIVKLNFCNDGPNVNVYIDIDQPGGIKFTSSGKKCNVEFTVSASTQNHQYILNFGSILDPVELTNLKYSLSLDCYYPCPKYKNPFDTKITNTYLKGGDRVKFVVSNPKNIRQAVTADIPTVFRLKRRIIDVGVGYNNLTVLVGGLACPNEIFALGNNCHGELGIGSNETVVSWRQLNRCIFDCQVNKVFSGKYVTFYVTQSNSVYSTGQWKCFVNSTSPQIVKSICQAWKITDIAISTNQILLLGSDGCIFGLGDNHLGELGLCHLDCVKKPTPISFFYKLSNSAVKQFNDSLSHPVEKNNRKNNRPFNPCEFGNNGGPCAPGPCGPFGPFGPFNNNNFNNNYGPEDYNNYRSNKYPRGTNKYQPNGRLHSKRGY
ncbi:putative regulator of chromosome condensation [Cotonvirus japonicus]|uniref:Regulator of chromosome condensation n=1 Tax=Cotonvirus japonicus TaxID=2811091 RepID=A0ABM7NT03_9VIRU|nr:putative regulator of chromosome condensation [Cotonvirus japonicus]BCS83231.1 putative regulator of chromosome condensation [Cotonvirus japonicus]